jgi:hypothetical protein
MKKFIFAAAFVITFLLGYGFSRLTYRPLAGPHVTGISGIFFKAKDPAALKAWYQKNLGMRMVQSGTNFEWHQGMDSTKEGGYTLRLLKKRIILSATVGGSLAPSIDINCVST